MLFLKVKYGNLRNHIMNHKTTLKMCVADNGVPIKYTTGRFRIGNCFQYMDIYF